MIDYSLAYSLRGMVPRWATRVARLGDGGPHACREVGLGRDVGHDDLGQALVFSTMFWLFVCMWSLFLGCLLMVGSLALSSSGKEVLLDVGVGMIALLFPISLVMNIVSSTRSGRLRASISSSRRSGRKLVVPSIAIPKRRDFLLAGLLGLASLALAMGAVLDH